MKQVQISEFAPLISNLRVKKPLVHHITNYVTVNDCANITLAIGASPIMADAIEEAADIAAIASSVVLNMGTLNRRTITSMIAAGKSANQHNIPVVFDPVGAGASQLRNEAAQQIMSEVKVDVLRGNISEIRFISGIQSNTKGVDAAESDATESIEAGEIAQNLAAQIQGVVAITGAIDIISNGQRTLFIENGHPALSGITGTGCMCTSLVGSFCGASPDKLLEATTTAILSMGIAGEIAYGKAGKAGNGSFHMALLDAISLMDAQVLTKGAKLHEA